MTQRLTKWWKFGGRIYVTCPGPGEGLPLDHDIASDGRVSPSLDCPLCEYHEFVELADWDQGERKRNTNGD